MRKFCNWLLYKRMGWQKRITVPLPEKFIICLAPHTSNWDFLMGQLYSKADGLRIGFLMKKEWFFWPLGPIFRRMGGVPVYRSKKTSLTENLTETLKNADKMILCITPEGTRKATPYWKRGFYYIALNAKIPVLLYALDYEKKEIICTRVFEPTGNVDEEMKEIKRYYKDIKGKKPEQFTIGDA